jgi:hypothetical protein
MSWLVSELVSELVSYRTAAVESLWGRFCQNLVAEARDSSGTQRKGNVKRWKPLPSNAVKTVPENTSLCVMVIYKV